MALDILGQPLSFNLLDFQVVLKRRDVVAQSLIIHVLDTVERHGFLSHSRCSLLRAPLLWISVVDLPPELQREKNRQTTFRIEK